MSTQKVEDIITTLYDMIQDARSLPLGADKCILERDKVLDMLDEIIAALPAELKQSRNIVDSRNEVISQARREAESIVRQANEEAARLVSEQEILAAKEDVKTSEEDCTAKEMLWQGARAAVSQCTGAAEEAEQALTEVQSRYDSAVELESQLLNERKDINGLQSKQIVANTVLAIFICGRKFMTTEFATIMEFLFLPILLTHQYSAILSAMAIKNRQLIN